MSASEPPITRSRTVIRDTILRSLQAVELEAEQERKKFRRKLRRTRRPPREVTSRRSHKPSSFYSSRDGMRMNRSAGSSLPSTRLDTASSVGMPLTKRKSFATKVTLHSAESLGVDAMHASIGEGRLSATEPATRRESRLRSRDTHTALTEIAESRDDLPDAAIVPPRIASITAESQPHITPEDLRALWDGFAPTRSAARVMLDPSVPLGRPGPRGCLQWDDEETEGEGGGAKGERGGETWTPHDTSVPMHEDEEDHEAIMTRLLGRRPHKTDRDVHKLLRNIHKMQQKMIERVELG